MPLNIPLTLSTELDLAPEQIRRDLAIGLYADNKVSLGKAASFAELTQREFLLLLKELRVPLHYDVADLEEDLMVIQEIG